MKNLVKKLALVSFVVCLVLSMTACGKEAAKVEYDSATVTSVAQFVAQNLYGVVDEENAKKLSEADIEDIEAVVSNIESSYGLKVDAGAFQSGLSSYLSAVEELGSVAEVSKDAKISADDKEVIADLTLTGTNLKADGSPRTAELEVILTKRMAISSIAVNVERTWGEKITNAALNTVLGMGTTFVVLIFISIVIWLMGLIVTGAQKKTEAPKTAAKPASAPAPAVEKTEVPAAPAAADDQELIAVIAAAIAAYESEATGVYVSPDTFVVRSLRRH
ncbi:sodium pump decarboxylases, gamma subunit [Lachnospiraceae bacterium]|nr:sodium pump decarboxylases, gamma subunit [Lachnospiraceae bacterium]